VPDLDETYRAIAADRDRFDDDDRSLWRAALARVLGRHPRDAIALAAVALAVGAILVNALHLQPGPHPAPIFKIRPRPVASGEINTLASLHGRPTDVPTARADTGTPMTRPRTDVVADIQRELAKRNFYDGPADGISGPKTDVAIRDFIQAAGLKIAAEPSDDLLRALARSPVKAPAARVAGGPARVDPIAELIEPSTRRVLAVQRALAEAGYAQIKPTGVFGPETRAAIEKFERERKLPITGQISDRLMRELAVLTGEPLE
jgi:peptidoglycan hydrolase-like protein with peptidoglycan-binding domain